MKAHSFYATSNIDNLYEYSGKKDSNNSTYGSFDITKYTNGLSEGDDLALYIYGEAHKDNPTWTTFTPPSAQTHTTYYIPVAEKDSDGAKIFMKTHKFYKASNIDSVYAAEQEIEDRKNDKYSGGYTTDEEIAKYIYNEAQKDDGEWTLFGRKEHYNTNQKTYYYVPRELVKDDMKDLSSIEKYLTNFYLKDNIDSLAGANDDDDTTDDDTTDDDPFSNVIDGLAGLLLYPIKVIPLLIGKAMSLLMAAFAGSKAGALDVEDILFNKVELTDINFFDLNPSDATVKTIRLSVAAWYYSVRNVAIVALLVICIYVGIRMAIATVAEEKAKYKEMLIDWATGLALVFVLHYIMIFIININNALVDIFAKGLDADSGDVMEKFFTQAWQVGFTNGFISAVCYVTLVGITFVFLLSYIKRMITIGFLIVIAPLVTVTYSLDKMGDSKSQALNTWFKEFSYNILIQPFQCVAYLALANTSYQLLAQSNSEHLDEMFRSAVLAFVMLLFVLESEKIIKHIFHFESETMSDGLKEAAVGAAILGESRKAIANRSKNQGGQPSPSGSGEGSSEEAEARKKMAQNEIKYSSANANNVNSGDFSNSGTDASTNSRRNGSSNSNTTVSQNDNNSSKNKPSDRQRMAREGANVFGTVGGNRYVRGYANFVKKASAAMLGGALITGMTGDAKTGTLAGIESWRTVSKTPTKAGTAITKQSHKNQLAKSYNNYVNQYAEEHSGEGLTQQQINDAARQHAIDLMNADSEDSLSGSDREFKHALENVYADAGGATVKDNYMRLNQTLNDIEDGKIGETTIQKKFKGKINAGQAKKAKKAQEEQVVDDSDTFRMNFTEYDKNHPNNSNNA